MRRRTAGPPPTTSASSPRPPSGQGLRPAATTVPSPSPGAVSKTWILVALRRLVAERASLRCELCLLPADLALLLYPHKVDHVIAAKHGGATGEGNLAPSCWRCNRHRRVLAVDQPPEASAVAPSSCWRTLSASVASFTATRQALRSTLAEAAPTLPLE